MRWVSTHVWRRIGTHDAEGWRTFQRPGDVCLGCSDPEAGHWVPISECRPAMLDYQRTYPLRWVRRNEDKPHRCPQCHSIPERCRAERLGPRTAVSCARCGVKWRMGVRYTATLRRRLHRRTQHPQWNAYIRQLHAWRAEREAERHAS